MLYRILYGLSEYLYLAPVILLSLSFHEFSHAFVSYKLGDPTAKYQGRLTLNPLKHLDILGTIMMFVAKIGWAKPVPINPMYYKNRKKGTILVSIAGPLSNILLALIFCFPMVFLQAKYPINLLGYFHPLTIIYTICLLFFIVNINLAVFNIIPVPPLDGSKILSGILPSRYYFKLMEYENYIGILFLIIVLVFPNQLSYVMSLIARPIQLAIFNIVSPIINMLL